jgi:hypothetical protein
MQKEIQSLIIQYGGEEYAAKEIYKLVLERDKETFRALSKSKIDPSVRSWLDFKIKEINSEIQKLK